MLGYLLDTNIIIFWFDPKSKGHANVVARIDALDPATPLRISAISWGEMEYGHRAVQPVDTPDQIARNQVVENQLPHTLDVRKTTKDYYGLLRARLFAKYAPKPKKKGLRPEQLIDPVTSKELGIQENDVWIAAQALEYNLVLVTHDKLDHLREVASDILTIEDWAS